MKIDKRKYPNVYRGHQYALDIISGKIASNIYIMGACERYLSDIKTEETAAFYFDIDAAERYLRVVQKFEHSEGHWKTKNIIYEPWQCWVFMNIMGFKMKDTGFRRFRVAHVDCGRGQGKSTLASSMGLYFLALDNPNGNYVSTVATKRDQARIVLDSARAMARKNTSFLRATGVEVLAHTITHRKSNSIMRALSSDHGSLDGLKDVLAICDELHAMNRGVFEVISSGMSKRKDSLLMCITTAGSDTSSVGYFQRKFAEKISTGEVQDDSFFAAVYTLDEDDDWADEDVWVKANPNIGISVDIDSLRSKVEKAMVTPSDIANIRIKHMNQWISEANAFFDLKAWDACEDRSLKLEDFLKKNAKIGIDLASHIDITSIGYVFRENGIYYLFEKSFLPQDTIDKKNNPFYENCLAAQELIPTPGVAINYNHIKEEVFKAIKDYRVDGVYYDPWNATQMANDLAEKTDVIKFNMTAQNFSEPMKKLDALMRQGKIRHNGSSLLRWCLGNVVAKVDHNSNVFPRKSNEKMKIDPVIALLMALAGWLIEPDKTSVYKERGIRTL